VTDGLKYREVLPISRGDAEDAFAKDQPESVIHALLSLAYHDPDWRWVQSFCVKYARHEDLWVRRTAVTCLGHLARIHGEVDEDIILPLLEDLSSQSELSGWVNDALDDIRMFAGEANA
jgi:hypothetical protein